VRLPGLRRRAHPNPLAPGRLVVVRAGESTGFDVQPGRSLVVGRDPGAAIVIDDPKVSPNHAVIERRGPGWLVHSLDAANPAMILDATGRAQPIWGTLGLRSAELLIGDCPLILYEPPSMP
jgi:pSer/pThr/pTyr-binding forkhead associated (FHA) protein